MTEYKVTGWRLMNHWSWNIGKRVISEVFACVFLTGFDYKCFTGSPWHRTRVLTILQMTSGCVITLDCVHLFWQHGSWATGWHRKSDGRWTCKYKKDLSFSASFRSMELRLIMMKFHKCYNVTSTRMKNIFILRSICFSMQFWCENEIDC